MKSFSTLICRKVGCCKEKQKVFSFSPQQALVPAFAESARKETMEHAGTRVRLQLGTPQKSFLPTKNQESKRAHLLFLQMQNQKDFLKPWAWTLQLATKASTQNFAISRTKHLNFKMPKISSLSSYLLQFVSWLANQSECHPSSGWITKKIIN